MNKIIIYSKLNSKYVSNLLNVIYEPEKDKFVYLIMELRDLNTLMLRDEEFNYRHNKNLLKFLYEFIKKIIFLNLKNLKKFLRKKNTKIEDFTYIKSKEDKETFTLIDYNFIKFKAKKFL